jgi:hypothetical protein
MTVYSSHKDLLASRFCGNKISQNPLIFSVSRLDWKFFLRQHFFSWTQSSLLELKLSLVLKKEPSTLNSLLYQGCQVPKVKKAKFGRKQFQKRPNSLIGKRPNFPKRFAKIYQMTSKTSLNVICFVKKIAKICLKRCYFLKDPKRPNGQSILFLANSFKKAKWRPRIICLKANPSTVILKVFK